MELSPEGEENRRKMCVILSQDVIVDMVELQRLMMNDPNTRVLAKAVEKKTPGYSFEDLIAEGREVCGLDVSDIARARAKRKQKKSRNKGEKVVGPNEIVCVIAEPNYHALKYRFKKDVIQENGLDWFGSKWGGTWRARVGGTRERIVASFRRNPSFTGVDPKGIVTLRYVNDKEKRNDTPLANEFRQYCIEMKARIDAGSAPTKIEEFKVKGYEVGGQVQQTLEPTGAIPEEKPEYVYTRQRSSEQRKLGEKGEGK